jgi:hypothetical protein
MWGGHSCPPPLTLPFSSCEIDFPGVTAQHLKDPKYKANFKSGTTSLP